jgi:3-methyl-2-oxobutanoate hydroxymethyltransferase
MRDARAVDAVGCFLLVVEGVMEQIARDVTAAVSCPTIGIGASVDCDGQVLVIDDLLGMFERVPRFVKRYESLAETITGAVTEYAAEVRNRSFPTDEQVYRPKK